MNSLDPVQYSLDIRPLGDKGYEVLVTIVNEGEDWLVIEKGIVEISKDKENFGRHLLSFTGVDKGTGSIKLGQFENTSGRYHLNPDWHHKILTFKVEIFYKYGDRAQSIKLEKDIETQKIDRKNNVR